MPEDSRYDYERDTRAHYQSRDVASQYHSSFTTQGGIGALRFRLVAHRERSLIKRFLSQCPHSSVLDIPAGTGKLAPVLAAMGSRVVAADISAEMLAIAKLEYQRIGYAPVEFVVSSAEEIAEQLPAPIDAVVCLRLMQRVPRETKLTILSALSRVARYCIVSFGHDSLWHRVRRRIRRLLLGGYDVGASTLEPIAEIEDLLDRYFVRMACADVIPVLSQERIWLARSKQFNGVANAGDGDG